jgi:hypothetical protein
VWDSAINSITDKGKISHQGILREFQIQHTGKQISHRFEFSQTVFFCKEYRYVAYSSNTIVSFPSGLKDAPFACVSFLQICLSECSHGLPLFRVSMLEEV